ncbi:hypothetical protein JXB41_08095 [Candidatus Woesearchaeota archaeon]|nr:hypothetical protein [Candidatus Woesearchaeota archaeon]
MTEELASKLNLKIEFEDESNTKIKKAYGIFVGKEIIVLPIIFSDYFTPFAGATRPIKYVILGNKSLHIIIKNPNKIEKDFFTFKDWRGKLMLKHKIGGMNIISDKTLIQKIRQWENQILSMKKSVFYFSPKTSELLTKEDDSDKIIEYLKLLLKVSESLN